MVSLLQQSHKTDLYLKKKSFFGMKDICKLNFQLNVTKIEFNLGLLWVEASALTEATI